MFAPDNTYKSNWDTLITFILIFTCLVTPARLAFTFNDAGDKWDLDTWESVNLFIDICFFIDIIFNFNTAYIDEDFRVISDRKIIAKNYLKGWFTIDLIAIFQFQLVFNDSSGGTNVSGVARISKIGRAFKLIKLTRLLRIVKMVK